MKALFADLLIQLIELIVPLVGHKKQVDDCAGAVALRLTLQAAFVKSDLLLIFLAEFVVWEISMATFVQVFIR